MESSQSPYDNNPSMRGVRDRYLDILLTGGKTHPTTPSPAPRPTPYSWTPGKHMPAVQNTNAWTSPVTPVPTEHDVRLAEIAAGLVAAGGVEHRQTDTIRRLAEQLERSEKKVRALEEGGRRRSSGKQRGSFEEEDAREDGGGRMGRTEAKRHIRFTPRKLDNEPEEIDSRRERRASAVRSARKSSGEMRMLSELQMLRMDQESWKREKKRSKEESEKLVKMIADIRRNTQRLLTERDEHLRVIANLQDAANGHQRVTGLFSACTGNSEGRVSPDGRVSFADRVPLNRTSSPAPLFGDGRSPIINPNVYMERDGSPSSVRNFDFDGSRGHEEVFGNFKHGGRPAENGGLGSQASEREQDLRQELQLVLEENERLAENAEKVPLLEAENLDLLRRLRQAEQEENMQTDECVDLSQDESSVGFGDSAMAEELAGLLEEIDILEGICGAVNFRVNPVEADGLQDSISTVNVTHQSGLGPHRFKIGGVSNVAIVRDVTRRLGGIRSGLSVRYGQWLRSVANDDDSSSIHLSDPSQGGLDAALDETVDTEVIDSILRDA